MRAIQLLIAVAPLAACATYQAYDGPSQPKSATALISGDAKLRAELPLALVIRSVDGRTVDLRYASVAVTAGHHVLIVDCQVGGAAAGETSRVPRGLRPRDPDLRGEVRKGDGAPLRVTCGR